jgi:hypothetical protein
MKTLLFAVAPLALVLFFASGAHAQTPSAGVNDACCGKVCAVPSGCCNQAASPTKNHGTSTRCQALVYNAGTDAPANVPPTGAVCIQASGAVPATCIGGGQGGLAPPPGCVCVGGVCNSEGGNSCTDAAVNGCKANNAVITQANDSACGACPVTQNCTQ